MVAVTCQHPGLEKASGAAQRQVSSGRVVSSALHIRWHVSPLQVAEASMSRPRWAAYRTPRDLADPTSVRKHRYSAVCRRRHDTGLQDHINNTLRLPLSVQAHCHDRGSTHIAPAVRRQAGHAQANRDPVRAWHPPRPNASARRQPSGRLPKARDNTPSRRISSATGWPRPSGLKKDQKLACILFTRSANATRRWRKSLIRLMNPGGRCRA
jgi:hypothetical protein